MSTAVPAGNSLAPAAGATPGCEPGCDGFIGATPARGATPAVGVTVDAEVRVGGGLIVGAAAMGDGGCDGGGRGVRVACTSLYVRVSSRWYEKATRYAVSPGM